jgi:hypothetical protein
LDQVNWRSRIGISMRPRLLINPRDFRPIRLINFFAKLVTEGFCLQVVPRMNELVSPCQNTSKIGQFMTISSMSKNKQIYFGNPKPHQS